MKLISIFVFLSLNAAEAGVGTRGDGGEQGNGGEVLSLACAAEAGVGTRGDGGEQAEAGVGTRGDGGEQGNGGEVLSLACAAEAGVGTRGDGGEQGNGGEVFSLACAAEAGGRELVSTLLPGRLTGARRRIAARRVGARRLAALLSAVRPVVAFLLVNFRSSPPWCRDVWHRHVWAVFQELKQDKKRRGCASGAAEGEG
ncbi:unnamed protein product [Closterium sp. Naga37s-1]|nr:unnamed protein product [Closterium sp. Naga37s-1]